MRAPTGYTGPLDPGRDRWPDLVDGRALELLERWWACFQEIALHISAAEQGAAYGHGQADLRTWQRGGDPVVGRLDWDQPAGDDPDQRRPPRLADPEIRAMRKLVGQACDRLHYDLAWMERQLQPPQQNTG